MQYLDLTATIVWMENSIGEYASTPQQVSESVDGRRGVIFYHVTSKNGETSNNILFIQLLKQVLYVS